MDLQGCRCVGMAYVIRSVMDLESHKTVYAHPELCPIMDDLPMTYAITINEWQKYATFGNQAKNEMYMERCHIIKTPTGHKIWHLSSMKDHEYIAFYCNNMIIVAKNLTKVLTWIASWINNNPCNLCKWQSMTTDFYMVEIN